MNSNRAGESLDKDSRILSPASLLFLQILLTKSIASITLANPPYCKMSYYCWNVSALTPFTLVVKTVNYS